MRRQFAVPLALLFIALGVPSNAQSDTAADTPAPAPAAPALEETLRTSDFIVQYYIVGHNFTLNCSTSRATDKGNYVWKKNGTKVEEQADLRDRYKLDEGGAVFTLGARTSENDFGNYSCSLASAESTPLQTWDVRGRPVAKLPANANVVEKQSVKLTCKLVGKPYPPVMWTVANSTEDHNGTDVRTVLGDRAKLDKSEQGVENGELVLTDAERWDAGVYTCRPMGTHDALSSSTTLRVKDQYAALWPFLGICAEVFVLCAIILVYEKRRTKPELDDSDTDNHDQKKS